MFDFIFRRTQEEAHASEKELFSLADGELSRGEATRLRAHLEHCWKCRVLAEKHEQTIAKVVDYVHRDFAQRIPPPPNSWRGFESKLRHAQAGPRLPAQHRGLKLWLGVQNRWLAGAAGVATALAVVAMLIGLFPKAPVVSAAALLQQSVTSDQTLLATRSQVVRRSFTLEERRPSTGEVLSVRRVETWQGYGKKMARRVYSNENKLVAAEWSGSDGTRTLYDHSHLRVEPPGGQNTLEPDSVWRRSPCAEDFTRVTQDVGKITVEVLPTVYILRYRDGATRGAPRLLNASLTLRHADLHAVEETMRVEQDAEVRDYRLVETSFEARPAPEVAASAFEVDPGLAMLSHSETAQGVPLSVVTAALQIAVLARLDQTEALLQQQVAVKRGHSGAILVEGVVDSQERKAQVIGSLGDMAKNPAVKVSLLTAAEADRRQLQGPPPQLQLQSTEALETHIAAAADLREYLRRIRHLSGEQLEREETGFADEILTHATRAQLNTQVLRQITGAVSDADLSSLPASARKQWEQMIQSHAATVQTELAKVREQLTDVLGERSVPPIPAPDLSVSASVVRLSDLVGIADRGVWQSFSSSTGATDAPAVAGAPFWQALNEAESVASSIVEKTK